MNVLHDVPLVFTAGPLSDLTGAAYSIARSNLKKEVRYRDDQELNGIGRALEKIIAAQKAHIEYLNLIVSGKCNEDPPVFSEDDEMGDALAIVKNNLKQKVSRY
jgi:hypothetical protein